MKSLWLLVQCLLVFSFPSGAQQKWDGMSEVVLEDHTHVTLFNRENSRLEWKYKALILNEKAKDKSFIKLDYNKFRKITSLKVNVTDLAGKLIKRYTLKDCQDYGFSGDAFVLDERVKVLELQENYPFIVEFECKMEMKGSLNRPVWIPLQAEKQKIKYATYTITDLQGIGIRHKEFHVNAPSVEELGTGKKYTWEVKDVGPIESAIFVYDIAEIYPVVYVGSKDFQMGSYRGNMESWKEFGNWLNLLMEGKNDLRPEDLKEIRNLCAPYTDPKDKIRIVYRYIQQNTRYVGIELGMGGWQPFNTRFVHEKKYGDCKALSFYAKALLEAVGIPAWYTVILAQKNAKDILPDFPMNNFNHAIVTIPLPGDTLWLECTSSVAPAGYIGTFTADRFCLAVNEEGGKLIRTKRYAESENRQHSIVKLSFAEGSGDADFEMHRRYRGLEIENDGFIFIRDKSEKEQRKWLLDHAEYGNLQLGAWRMDSLKGDVVPASGYVVSGRLKGFGSLNTGRYFISPFVFSALPKINLPQKERKYDITVRYPYIHSDTIRISLPEGYKAESEPTGRELETIFGYYKTCCVPEGDQLVFIREFHLKSGKYPAASYPEFRDFLLRIAQYDREKTVFARSRL